MKYDVAVIGSGMAGLTAAVYLARRGVNTAVVSKGNPICSISTGCVDIIATNGSIRDGLHELPPDHPYRKLREDEILGAIGFFRDVMAEAGLHYVGDPEQNRTILTPIGRRRTTAFVPSTMEHAHIQNGESLHVVSFWDIKDFFPSFITGAFANTGISVFDAGVRTTIGIATRMDDDGFLDTFVRWLRRQHITAERVAMPAVLGITNTTMIHERIAQAVGRPVFEIPTLPPSVPGLRLFRRLRKSAETAGVAFYSSAEIAGVRSQGSRIEGLTLAKPGRPDYVDADAFILATGSFVSGGLVCEQSLLRETVFNIPVHRPPGPELFNESFFTLGQPIEQSGIRVDDRFVPVDADYDNLFAAGSILAYSETMKYQCGHGMAIATAVAAAGRAEELVR